MQIKLSLKQLGKKHALLEEQPLEIEWAKPVINLEQLILAIVQQQVNQYYSREAEQEDADATHAPLNDYLSQLLTTGKIGFANRYNPNDANLQEASEHAIQAFKDGIYAVFYGEREMEALSQEIDLSLNQTFTFIRLTFLAGSYW